MASDSFSYSTGDLATVSSGVWTNHGVGYSSLNVSADGKVNTPSAGAWAIYSRGTSSADQTSQCVVTGPLTNHWGYAGPAVRCGGSGNTRKGYVLGLYNAGSPYIQLLKITSGAGDSTGFTGPVYSGTINSGDTIKLSVSGNTLTGYLNGAQILSYTDTSGSPHTTGETGIAISDDGNLYIDDWSDASAPATVKKLKLLAHSSAASASSVSGVVFAVPTGGAITGAKIGEFTGKSFEASLESGQAVLKVPVADFGGSSLTTSDTPVALVRNSTNTTGIISTTIIEE